MYAIRGSFWKNVVNREQVLLNLQNIPAADDYWKDALNRSQVGVPKQMVFAASHTSDVFQHAKLKDYDMIPNSTLMSFPQFFCKKIAKGCLLLSIMANHIFHMSKYSVKKKIVDRHV